MRSHVRNRAKSHLCTCMWGSDRLRAGRQEVGKCSTRGESWGMYITFASAKIANKAEPTLALKPRGDVTSNPKQGYQWPQKRTCVRQKLYKKKKKKKKVINFFYLPGNHTRNFHFLLSQRGLFLHHRRFLHNLQLDIPNHLQNRITG